MIQYAIEQDADQNQVKLHYILLTPLFHYVMQLLGACFQCSKQSKDHLKMIRPLRVKNRTY